MVLKPNNSFYNLFVDKKILIIAPHQDDELFLCGTIIGALRTVSSKIYVVFVTNGDYGNSFFQRKKESIEALNVFKISKKNIFFLGYGDQYDTDYGHIYHAPEDEIVKSINGNTCTYGDEYCFIKHGVHHEYTFRNFKNDFTEIIEDIYPDVIFCNDLDWHPDHRAVSLMFDHIMGDILKRHNEYHPEVYKGFVYFLGWDGKQDYKMINLASTKKPRRVLSNDRRFELGNPYFLWSERICFPIDNNLLLRKRNKLYKSILKYKFSRNAKKNFYSMMNADAVFWRRHTINMGLSAYIEVSSGEANFLNDFVIVDSSDIMKKSLMPYDCGIWYPNKNDEHPCIKFHFEKYITADKVIFYRDINSYGIYDAWLKIKIKGKRNGKNICVSENTYINKNDVKIEKGIDANIFIKEIVINISNSIIGFSEIEIVKNVHLQFIKIKIKGNYVYHYYLEEDCKEMPIEIVTNECGINMIKKEIIQSAPNFNCVKWQNNVLLFENSFERCVIRASLKNNTNVFDTIIIEKWRCKM